MSTTRAAVARRMGVTRAGAARFAITTCAALALVAAGSACSSTSSTSSSAKSHGTSTASALKLNAKGVPQLAGLSIPMGKGAGAPHVGDTVAYIQDQLLQQWGATSSLTLGDPTAVISGVLGGHLAATGGPFDAELNGGLIVFGPSQPGQDYTYVAQKGITNVSQLRGKVVDDDTLNDGEDVFTKLLLREKHLTGKVTIEYTGTEDNSLAAFVAGRAAAFWASGDSIVALREKHIAFNILTTGRQLDPSEADSYVASTPQWIKTHFAEAEAIDLAWLYAAKVFDTNEKLWTQDAAAYTKGTVPMATIELDYAAYKTEAPWPDNASAFTPANVKANFQEDVSTHGITKLTSSTPESTYADFGPWDAALKLFLTHYDAAP